MEERRIPETPRRGLQAARRGRTRWPSGTSTRSRSTASGARSTARAASGPRSPPAGASARAPSSSRARCSSWRSPRSRAASRAAPGGREARAAQHEARRYATRLDTHAFLKQLASPHSGAVELYRRNYLELLRHGHVPVRGVLPLARDRAGPRGPSSATPSRACARRATRPRGAWPTPSRRRPSR